MCAAYDNHVEFLNGHLTDHGHTWPTNGSPHSIGLVFRMRIYPRKLATKYSQKRGKSNCMCDFRSRIALLRFRNTAIRIGLVKFSFCAYKYIITEIKSLNGYGVVEAKLKPEAHHKNEYVRIYLGQAVLFESSRI